MQVALGENVGKLMKARGLSNGQVARGAGIADPQTVFALVKRKSKKSDYAGQLAAYFNVPLVRLMADDFDPAEARILPGAAFEFRIDEAEAMKRLRTARPEWRRYVLSLAMMEDPEKQKTFLDIMSEAVPDVVVEKAYGVAGKGRE